jgi:adenylyl-sulfate kinase
VKTGGESGGPASPRGGSGVTIWFTGLPCSGKTTLAQALAERLKEHGSCVEVLDGDAVRAEFSPELSFSKTDREINVRRIALLCGLLNRHGIVAIAAVISPYAAGRREARRLIESRGAAFVEIHCQCALEELRRRDVKGLYRRAERGEVPLFTGISDPYETPVAPEIRLATDVRSVEDCLAEILARLRGRLGITSEGH